MKIISLKWRNFLSWGDELTQIDFNQSEKILIKGKQGQGKSSIIDVLHFALFGKLIRTKNNRSVINNYNKANLLTQITIENDGKTYDIYRTKGSKSSPMVVEIYEDGNKLDINDKQFETLFIEKNIVGNTTADFGAMCLIDLPDLPDVTDMNFMNFLTKLYNMSHIDKITNEYISEHKLLLNKINTTEASIYRQNSSIELLGSVIERNNTLKSEDITKAEEAIAKLILAKDVVKSRIDDAALEVTECNKKLEIERVNNNQYQNNINLLNQEIYTRKNRIAYISNDKCGYCGQAIDGGFKDKEITSLNNEINILSAKIDEQHACITNSQMNTFIQELQTATSNHNECKMQMNTLDTQIGMIQSQIDKDKLVMNTDTDSRLTEMINNKQSNELELERLKERMDFVTLILKEVLCEYGFKYEYLLSKLYDINMAFDKYLPMFEIEPTKVIIDDSFNLKIYRLDEEFEYDMLSNGEKAIISAILILFKLSIQSDVGIKVFDETLDASLTQENLEIMIGLIADMYKDDMLIFITHKLHMIDLCDSVYDVSKDESIFSSLNVINK